MSHSRKCESAPLCRNLPPPHALRIFPPSLQCPIHPSASVSSMENQGLVRRCSVVAAGSATSNLPRSRKVRKRGHPEYPGLNHSCLLYTSDAADERSSVD